MALTPAGLESRAARATFEEVVVEVSYFALDLYDVVIKVWKRRI